jgi:hypothetical protein
LATATINSPLVDVPNHRLSIYSNSQEKLDAAFKFLKDGLLNNECILLITDELDKDQVIERMVKEYPEFDVLKLLEDGVITILSSRWYFVGDSFDGDRAKIKWKKAVDESLSKESLMPLNLNGKISGLRAFGDTKSFFNNERFINGDRIGDSLVDKLIHYECSLEKRFSFPLNGICAYEAEDIAKLDKKQLKSLMEHHGLIHRDNYNELIDPSQNSHIILLYNDQLDLNNAISSYINEGLKRGQLCVHASVCLQNDDYLLGLSSKINGFNENVKNGNLVLVDLANYYLAALMDNLQEFDKLKDDLMDKAKYNKNRKDKNIRLTLDCPMFLLKNKHFDECIRLENWWHTKQFAGSCVFAYPQSLLSQFPFNYYLFKLFHKDDVVIDSESSIMLDYVKNSDHHSKLVYDMTMKFNTLSMEVKKQ